MKTLKKFDLTGQLFVVAASCIYYGSDESAGGGSFLWIYLLTGGWQFLSFILHSIVDGATWYSKKQRMAYGRVVLWTLILGVFSFTLSGITDGTLILVYLVSLLFITPLFAIWYFIIGFMELKAIQQKELIHLK